MVSTTWPATVIDRSAAAAPPAAFSTPLLRATLAAADALVIAGTSYLSFLLWLGHDGYALWPPYAVATVLGTVLALNCIGALRLYNIETLARPFSTPGRVLSASMLVAGVLIVLSYLTKTSAEYSRVWAGLWFLQAMAGVAINRLVIAAMIRRGSLDQALRKRVVIVGELAHVQRLSEQFERRGDHRWIHVIRTFAADRPVNLDLSGIEQCIRTNDIDTVVVALPWIEEDLALKALQALYEFPVDVLLAPRGIGLSLSQPRIHNIGDIPMLALANRPLAGWRYLVKELEDRVLASLILALILPLLLLIAIAIKLDSRGPVLFRQNRFGFNNQLFEVWKFRTMYHDQCDLNAETLTRRNDPRVTPVGRFLRAYSLDELPQFFNVLRGDMSIVGPRPHAVAAKAGGLPYQDAVRQYAARHRVKPGITGWAQVNGWRGETETVEQIQRRVHHDIAYIEDWSLWLDLKIILLTVVTGFFGKQAY